MTYTQVMDNIMSFGVSEITYIDSLISEKDKTTP